MADFSCVTELVGGRARTQTNTCVYLYSIDFIHFYILRHGHTV